MKDMKHIITVISLALTALLTSNSFADTWVNSYTRSDGTNVSGHYRSDPNSTVRDNFSYKGNTNPYTGSTGTNYYRNSPSSEYYSGSTLYNGGGSTLYNGGGSTLLDW